MLVVTRWMTVISMFVFLELSWNWIIHGPFSLSSNSVTFKLCYYGNSRPDKAVWWPLCTDGNSSIIGPVNRWRTAYVNTAPLWVALSDEAIHIIHDCIRNHREKERTHTQSHAPLPPQLVHPLNSVLRFKWIWYKVLYCLYTHKS